MTTFAVLLAVLPRQGCCGNVHPAAASIYHYHIAIALRSQLYEIMHAILRYVKFNSPFPPIFFHLRETSRNTRFKKDFCRVLGTGGRRLGAAHGKHDQLWTGQGTKGRPRGRKEAPRRSDWNQRVEPTKHGDLGNYKSLKSLSANEQICKK